MAYLKHFHFWCQKVLPLVYDDSLSYYEVLCKVVNYINKLIDEDAEIIENVDALKLEVERIQKWIKDFNGKSVYKSVRDYGAFGDGIHDDTQAFQDMLEDTDNYGFFYIPAGEYIVSDTVEVPSNCRIVCDGTILSRMVSPGGGVHVGLFDLDGVENVTLTGLDIVGQVVEPITNPERSRTPDWMTAIYIHDSVGVNVENCRIRLWEGGYCILTEDSESVIVQGCYIKTYKFTGIAFHRVVTPSKHCKVVNNSVIDCYSRTITGESGTVPNTYPIKLSGYDNMDEPLHQYPCVDIVCIGNYVENYFAWWEGIDAHGGNDLVIADNIVKGCAKGITVSDKNDSTAKYMLGCVSITGNVVENQENEHNFYHNGSCFCVEVSGGTNVTITGNTLKNGGLGWTAVTGRRGGVYLAAVTNALVEGNNIVDANVSFFDIGDFADNVVIRDNVCRYTDNTSITGPITQLFTALNAAISSGAVFNGYYGNNTIYPAVGKSCREVQGSSVSIASYSRFVWGRNNKMGTFDSPGNFNVFVLTGIRANQIGALIHGMLGDICWNNEPATTEPIGWMCVSSEGADVSLVPAVWRAMPDLS